MRTEDDDYDSLLQKHTSAQKDSSKEDLNETESSKTNDKVPSKKSSRSSTSKRDEKEPRDSNKSFSRDKSSSSDYNNNKEDRKKESSTPSSASKRDKEERKDDRKDREKERERSSSSLTPSSSSKKEKERTVSSSASKERLDRRSPSHTDKRDRERSKESGREYKDRKARSRSPSKRTSNGSNANSTMSSSEITMAERLESPSSDHSGSAEDGMMEDAIPDIPVSFIEDGNIDYIPKAKVTVSGNGDVSCSIDETNRIRAMLGLRPLDIDKDRMEKEKKDEEARKAREAFEKEMRINEYREVLDKSRNKRLLHAQKVGISLSDPPEKEMSATEWVEYNRKITEERNKKEKELAIKRAKELQEFEQENSSSLNSDTHTQNDLKGKKIDHSINEIQEGQSIILTIKDKKIVKGGELDEDEDILENAVLSEEQKRKRAKALAKKSTVYDRIEEEDKELLSHYDLEEKLDQKHEKEMITLGEDELKEKRAEEVKKKLQNSSITKIAYNLEHDNGLKAESEYFTSEEMMKLRQVNPKKEKKKKLRTKKIELEEIEQLSNIDQQQEHGKRLGSQSNQDNKKVELRQRYEKALEKAVEKSKQAKEIEQEEQIATNNIENDYDDEEEDELYSTLSRSRTLAIKQKQKENTLSDVACKILEDRQKNPTINKKIDTLDDLVFTDTTEFVRNLPTMSALTENTPTPVTVINKKVKVDETKKPTISSTSAISTTTTSTDDNEMQIENADAHIKVEEPVEVDDKIDMNESPNVAGKLDDGDGENESEEEVVLMDEPRVDTSMSAALKYVQQKGYFQENYSGRNNDKMQMLINQQIDKADPAPAIQLDYIDEYGRQMTPKEAFRKLSHRFHGKTPGKMKMEKRMKKYEEEQKLKAMSSIDTPLMTVQAMQAKQVATKMPYIVLSGGNSAMSSAISSSGLGGTAAGTSNISNSSSNKNKNKNTGGTTGGSKKATFEEVKAEKIKPAFTANTGKKVEFGITATGGKRKSTSDASDQDDTKRHKTK